MQLESSVQDLIRRRSSVRKYRKQPIPAELRARLSDWLAAPPPGPFGNATRYRLVAVSEDSAEELKGLGTYGFIKDPPAFVVGGVRAGAGDLEDYGYVTEQAVLFATDLGLASCWLGGSFSKSSFAGRIDLEQDEILPAVFSVGLATRRRGALDRLIRWQAGSAKRRPWEALFFEAELGHPLTEERAGDLAQALELLRLAPSASNRQPWRLVLCEQGLHLFLRRSPKYQRSMRVMGLVDLQRVDMGIAMCHLDLAVRATGMAGSWEMRDPGWDLPEHLTYIATWLRSG